MQSMEYWDWAEKILEELEEPKAHHSAKYEKQNNKIDINQNNIVNVDLARDNLNL